MSIFKKVRNSVAAVFPTLPIYYGDDEHLNNCIVQTPAGIPAILIKSTKNRTVTRNGVMDCERVEADVFFMRQTPFEPENPVAACEETEATIDDMSTLAHEWVQSLRENGELAIDGQILMQPIRYDYNGYDCVIGVQVPVRELYGDADCVPIVYPVIFTKVFTNTFR